MTVGKLYCYLSKRLVDRSLSSTYLENLSALSFGVIYIFATPPLVVG